MLFGSTNLEINMGLSVTDTPYLLTARDRGPPSASQSLHRHTATDELELPRCKDEAPDPTYWTAYDLHMIEREARAMRRAHVYSMIAALWKRLRQRIFDNRLTA